MYTYRKFKNEFFYENTINKMISSAAIKKIIAANVTVTFNNKLQVSKGLTAMQSIYEHLRRYEENPTDTTLKPLQKLIDQQYILIQHEHPAQKRKIQGELQVVKDKLSVISNKQRFRVEEARQQQNREQLFQSNIDHTGIQLGELQMDYAHTQVDGMINQGRQFISELSDQNMFLRRTKNKILTSLSTLGVSQSLIAKINTRLSSDIWLFWLLVIVFIVVVYLFVSYVL